MEAPICKRCSNTVTSEQTLSDEYCNNCLEFRLPSSFLGDSWQTKHLHDYVICCGNDRTNPTRVYLIDRMFVYQDNEIERNTTPGPVTQAKLDAGQLLLLCYYCDNQAWIDRLDFETRSDIEVLGRSITGHWGEVIEFHCGCDISHFAPVGDGPAHDDFMSDIYDEPEPMPDHDFYLDYENFDPNVDDLVV